MGMEPELSEKSKSMTVLEACRLLSVWPEANAERIEATGLILLKEHRASRSLWSIGKDYREQQLEMALALLLRHSPEERMAQVLLELETSLKTAIHDTLVNQLCKPKDGKLAVQKPTEPNQLGG